MIDFHTHVLPGIDDGAKSLDDSIALIRELNTQSASEIVLTPHFYPDQQSMDQFLSKRNNAFNQLQDAYEDQNDTVFFLGAEVYCNEFLLISQNLRPLCIQGTSLLLLEMPFAGRWSPDLWRIIDVLSNKHAITPVIAHAERYAAVQKHPSKILRNLIDSGCMIQANCDSFVDSSTQSKMLKWLDNGHIHLLGTDCHDINTRPPRMKEACDVITNNLGAGVVSNLDMNASVLLSGKPLRNQNLFF